MTTRVAWRVLRAGMWVTVLLVLAACQRAPSEEALRAELEGLQQAVQARDAGKVESFLSGDFVGPEGMDRRAARRLATGMFLRYGQVGVRTGPLTVEMQDERHATARFTATTTGGTGGLLPQTGQLYQVETGWRVEQGQWKLLSARWTPAVDTVR